jgi:hypothetical protein
VVQRSKPDDDANTSRSDQNTALYVGIAGGFVLLAAAIAVAAIMSRRREGMTTLTPDGLDVPLVSRGTLVSGEGMETEQNFAMTVDMDGSYLE